MPQHLRTKLRASLSRIVRGPEQIDDFTRSAEFNEGMKAAVQRCAGWRHSWIEHELRQVLAWADGAESSNDIKIYDAGLDYDK